MILTEFKNNLVHSTLSPVVVGLTIFSIFYIWLIFCRFAWKQTKEPNKVAEIESVDGAKSAHIKLIEKVKANDIDGCKLILSESCNVNRQDEKGATALTYAVLEVNEVITKLLIEHGADCNIATFKGLTAKAIAKNNKLDSISKILASN